jgi:hypothetical protein
MGDYMKKFLVIFFTFIGIFVVCLYHLVETWESAVPREIIVAPLAEDGEQKIETLELPLNSDWERMGKTQVREPNRVIGEYTLWREINSGTILLSGLNSAAEFTMRAEASGGVMKFKIIRVSSTDIPLLTGFVVVN